MLEFRILGPLEVVDGRRAVRLGGPRQRSTLALLLLSAGRVVSVDRFADELYAGEPPVTAVTQVQRQISELRKALGPGAPIETRPPGYRIHLATDQLDLSRFETLTEQGSRALAQGDAEEAADRLGRALGLWRGDPLADLASEPFATLAIQRLEELRLAAAELRIEAELRLGRHRELVGELETLVALNPFRERLRAQLMLALYRAGRQAEALDAYRAGRALLVGELGIEPTPLLRGLERAILAQDPSLDAAPGPAAEKQPARTVLAVAWSEAPLDGLLAFAAQLGRGPGRELVVARLLEDEGQLAQAVADLSARRASLPGGTRIAAFTSGNRAADAVRLAMTCDAELLLLAASLAEGAVPDGLAAVLARSPADVAVLASGTRAPAGAGVFVPFGGDEHGWAALELGAWLALAAGLPLRLVGVKADRERGRRDASRLLADASLAIQRVVGIESAPLLVEPSDEALVAAVEPASAVVVGFPSRWREEGLGTIRRALVEQARPPVMVVHRGPRPGGLAPTESRTRFTWSIERP